MSCISPRPCRALCGCAVKSICLKRGWRVQRRWPTWWSPTWSCKGSQAPPTTWWPCWLTTSNIPALCLPSLTSRGWVSGPEQDLFIWHCFSEVKVCCIDWEGWVLLLAELCWPTCTRMHCSISFSQLSLLHSFRRLIWLEEICLIIWVIQNTRKWEEVLFLRLEIQAEMARSSSSTLYITVCVKWWRLCRKNRRTQISHRR